MDLSRIDYKKANPCRRVSCQLIKATFTCKKKNLPMDQFAKINLKGA